MGVFQQLKNVYHFFQAHYWRIFYGRPDAGMSLYAVTGTNGKTTTCWLLASILREHLSAKRVGMLSTVAFWVGEREQVNETKMTSLDSRQVYRLLAAMRRAGVTHAVVEVTSHALDQHRLAGLSFDAGIFLNISREHLDYHGTMERYAAAKARLLATLTPGGVVVGKEDDSAVARILDAARRRGLVVVTFTAAAAMTYTTSLPGKFNQENTAAAWLLAASLGVLPETIERAIARVHQVPGRMEWVDPPGGAPGAAALPRVLIDYAVTPAALARVYQEVRLQLQHSGRSGRLFAVLGAAGRRDRGKRPAMARAAAQYADAVVLTREDPWTEDEEQIFRDLESGLSPETGGIQTDGQRKIHWRRIADRREAIRWCIGVAGPQDAVVVTGKGAETGMAVGKKIIPWSDREVIQTLLAEATQAPRRV
ncbi:MAG: hypothetical protein COT71_01495 [Candidatus Andersenbacteria bacterium CG10_big_fil_rev_8_21_14_0_10_54_11]|uniref:UDP-N-acetylmuramoyl-L-alanyl-D-glutamate--2, 6-diaminopimelate ligase n=1 Tax=Candidatus Andersenbacteria bacterium CG10_big_fil_rev_8_21_14_0_10_54_11 TaxID=1974485 RepID=A0A2M6WZW0_9BACT|nr:MAG: hypothetical protein COT71_01495 [Candidatus Andersenbacteria bacterium CG10_big_fil_rev_8_21_14_0_10_54_11]